MAVLKYKNKVTGQWENMPVFQGKSAYQVAVDRGFEGTEDEWLDSLKGTGTIFTEFPREEQIRQLPENSYFTVRGNGAPDTQNETVNYYITRNWTRNALQYSTEDNHKIYVVPIGQASGEIYLPYYGIKTGETNARKNSEILNSLIPTLQYGSTFRFPVGHFYFSEPIDVSEKHISIIGTTNASFTNIDINGTTWLHFPSLSDDAVALTVQHCTLADFTIIGNPSQYSLVLNRDNALVDINTVIQESVTTQSYGIKASGNMNIRNVNFKHFYNGCWCKTANMDISNVSFESCHYGLTIGSDIKVYNIFGFNIMVLLRIEGSLTSAIGVRGDNIGEHLVEILEGGSHTLVDLDADFCMNSIIAVGDGLTNSYVKDLVITGIHGRSGVRHFYSTNEPEITANNITSNTIEEFGILAIKTGSTIEGAVVVTNQRASISNNPFDKIEGYAVPFILLSAALGTSVKDIQFITTVSTGGELITEWITKRIASFSTFADACSVRVQTGDGIVKYVKSNNLVTVVDDATDIYQRMDKTALALNAEVVKTVNGVQPDDNGNVVVTQVEPELVNSEEEFIDTSKQYALPDGYIYAYRKKFVPSVTLPNFTNQVPLSIDPVSGSGILNGVGYKQNTRYELDTINKIITESISSSDEFSTGLIPIKRGDVIRVNALGYHSTRGASIIEFVSNSKGAGGSIFGDAVSKIIDGGGSYVSTGEYADARLSDVEICMNQETISILEYQESSYIWFTILNTTPPENLIITVNEEITYNTTEDHYEWNWERTGELYIKPDYLDMITKLEEKVALLENNLSAEIKSYVEETILGGAW